MICVSINNKTYSEIVDILADEAVEMAEIRLDGCPLDDDEIRELFANSDIPLVATCRAANLEGEDPAHKAEHLLTIAVEAGAAFADLELDAPQDISKRFRVLCEENGTTLIRSWHCQDETPGLEYLRQIRERCYRYGAGIAKVVITANDAGDCARVLSLYEDTEPGRLIAFAMGPEGERSRLDCLAKGSPFTYAAVSEKDATAPGQWPLAKMREALYGSLSYEGSLSVPASKSFAQRAIFAAALADGTSRLHNYSPCDDCRAALALAESLGAKVRVSGSDIEIDGIAATPGQLATDTLNVGESGLLARLAIPVIAVVGKGKCAIRGEKTLLKRPLAGAADIMASFGVILKSEALHGTYVPLTVEGSIIPGTANISGKDSSQLISGLLMALPLCNGESKLYVEDPVSIPYMYMTLEVLRRFGVEMRTEMEGDARLLENQDWSGCTGINFKTKGNVRYHAAEIDIEGDWSAAANFMVAGAVFGSVRINGLDTSSLQADLGISDILVNAGASVSQEEDGTLCVRKAPLMAIDTDLTNSPDLFPIAAVLAAFCAGTSRIAGMGRLRNKESDRGEAIVKALSQMGVKAAAEGDVLLVEGMQLSQRLASGRLLKSGLYDSWGDHRMAMALKVASLGMNGPCEIAGKECVSKSFPDFFKSFEN